MDIKVRFFVMSTGLLVLFSVLLIFVLSNIATSSIISSAQDAAVERAVADRDSLSSISSDMYARVLPIYYQDIASRNSDFLFAQITGPDGTYTYGAADTSVYTGVLTSSAYLQGDSYAYEITYEGMHAYVVSSELQAGSGTILAVCYSLESAYGDASYSRTIVIIAISALCLAFAAASHHMSRDIIIRIQELCNATRELTDGDLSYRVPVTGKDELSRVMHSFNAMAQQRMEDEERLIELNRCLKEHYDELDTFAWDLYHGSQTPLSTIGGYLSVLEDAMDVGDVETARASASVIREAAKTLSHSHAELGNRIRDRCNESEQ